MRSQPGKLTIAMHILSNISRNKGSQTIKYDQSIEYNMRKVFIRNHTQNGVKKLFPDPFLKNQN